LVNTGSLEVITSSSADIVGDYFGIISSANSAVGFASNSSSVYSTSGYLFFSGVLVWQSSSGSLASSFYARPIGVSDTYQIYWLSDTSSATTSDVALALKTVAPAGGSIAALKK
jgi:hypothetical protein